MLRCEVGVGVVGLRLDLGQEKLVLIVVSVSSVFHQPFKMACCYSLTCQ